MDIIKKARVPIPSKGPISKAVPAPAKQKTIADPMNAATEKFTGPNQNTMPTTNIVGHPHPYSEDVKKMQNALLNIANELNIRHGKDNPNPELTKKLQDIARHVEGQGTAYGDGLWGNNTQEALNSVYSFVNDLTAHMNGEVKQKYTALLKQMESAGVGPGKQYNQVKNVDASAKTLFATIRTIVDNWNDDIEKAMVVAKNAPTQEPSATGTPPGTAAGVAAPASAVQQTHPGTQQQSQPGTITPISQQNTTQQPGQQNQQQTQKAQQIINPEDTGPFDLNNDVISMDAFLEFLQTVQVAQQYNIIPQRFINPLEAQRGAAYTSILHWKEEAKAKQAMDGFSLTGQNTDALVESNFNHDYVTARNMLYMLSEICSRLSQIVEMLRNSLIKEMPQYDAPLREQAQRGSDYIRRMSVMISGIEGALKSGKQPGGQVLNQYGTPPPPQGPPFRGQPPPGI